MAPDQLLPRPVFRFGQWEAPDGNGVGSSVRSGFSCPGFLSVTLLDAGCVPQPEASHPSSCQTASPHSSFLQARNRFLAQLPLLALRPRLLRAPQRTASHWCSHPHLYETLLKLHRVKASFPAGILIQHTRAFFKNVRGLVLESEVDV